MQIKEAVALLKKHNKWRRGDDRIKMTDAINLGIAIDVVTKYLDKEIGVDKWKQLK